MSWQVACPWCGRACAIAILLAQLGDALWRAKQMVSTHSRAEGSSTSMFYLEAPNLCFGHRFYKRHHLPRLVFERALWCEKRARMVAKTCALYCKFAARGVQSTSDPLGIVHANLISVKLGTAIAHLQTQPTTTAIV